MNCTLLLQDHGSQSWSSVSDKACGAHMPSNTGSLAALVLRLPERSNAANQGTFTPWRCAVDSTALFGGRLTFTGKVQGSHQ